MRVFVTGATGFVGSAVVQELVRAGHQVLGLARSEASAEQLRAIGVEVHRGDVGDVESLRSGAAQADGVIHTAFIHDFANFQECCEVDRRAIQALGSALVGTERPLIVTSGCGILPQGRRLTEDVEPDYGPNAHPRVASEQSASAVAAQGVRVLVVRLPPSVHGEGDHGFVPILINIAREKGISAFLGDGQNVWPTVHRLDAARLYRLALEKGVAGARYHSVAEEGVPFREIAGAIGRQLNLPVVSQTPEEAKEHFGWFAPFAGMNLLTSSQQTRQQLDWNPEMHGLVADLEQSHYFKA